MIPAQVLLKNFLPGWTYGFVIAAVWLLPARDDEVEEAGPKCQKLGQQIDQANEIESRVCF